jgi:hypothetical protein
MCVTHTGARLGHVSRLSQPCWTASAAPEPQSCSSFGIWGQSGAHDLKVVMMDVTHVRAQQVGVEGPPT